MLLTFVTVVLLLATSPCHTSSETDAQNENERFAALQAVRKIFDIAALQVLWNHSPDNSPFLQDHLDLSSVFPSPTLNRTKSELLTNEGEIVPGYEHGISVDFSATGFRYDDQIAALNSSWNRLQVAFSAHGDTFNVTHDSSFSNMLSKGPLVADLNTTYDIFIEKSHLTEKAYNPLGRRISMNSVSLRKWEKIAPFILNREKAQFVPSTLFEDVHAELVNSKNVTVDRLDGQDSVDAILDLIDEVKIPAKGAQVTGKLTFVNGLAVEGDIAVTSGLLSDYDLSLAFGHGDTSRLDSEFQFESPLRAEHLELPLLDIDSTFVLNNDSNVIEIDVQLDELQVDNLDVNSSMIGTFDLTENYLTTDDHVQEGLSLTSSGIVTFLDGLNVIHLNGHEGDFFTNSFLNLSSDHSWPELIFANVSLQGDFVPGGLINELSIPDDLMMVNDEWNVTGSKQFTNVTVVLSLNVTDKMDGLDFPDDLVTLTGVEEIRGHLHFADGLDTRITNSSSARSFIVTGSLNNTNMTQLREEFEEVVKQVNLTKEALSGNFHREVVVTGNVTVLGTINNQNLEEMALDILSNSTIDITKPLLLTGSKIVSQLTAFTCDIENINGVAFSNLSLVNDSQVFDSHVELQNVTQFNKLQSDDPNDSLSALSALAQHKIVDSGLDGNDVTVDELHYQSVRVDHLINEINSSQIVLAIEKPEWQDLGSKEFVNSLSFQSVNVTDLNFSGKLDAFASANFSRRVLLDLPQTLDYDSQLIDSSLASLTSQMINSVPTEQFLSNIFTKSGHQSILAQLAFHGQVNNFAPVTTHSGLFPGAISGNNVNYFAHALDFAHLEVEGNVTTEGGKVRNFRPNDFLFTESQTNQVVTSAFSLKKDINVVNLTVTRLFGPKENIFHPNSGFNILLTNQDQVIDGQTQLDSVSFESNVTTNISHSMVSHQEVINLLNSIVEGATLCDESTRPQDADLLIVAGPSTFDSAVNLKKFHGHPWKDLLNNLVIRNSRNTQTLPHKVRFEGGSVRLRGDIFAERAAVRKRLCKLNGKNISSLPSSEFNSVTFLDDVFISECNIESSVNGFHLSQLEHIVKREPPPPPESVDVDRLLVLGDVDVNTLNKKPVRGSLVPLDREVTLFGDISFSRGSHTSTSSLNVTGQILAYSNIEMLLPENKLSYIEQYLDSTESLTSASFFPRDASLLVQLSMDTFAIDYRVHEDQVYLLIEFKSSDSCTYWRCFAFDPHHPDFLVSAEAQGNLFGTLAKQCRDSPLFTVSGPNTASHVIHNESIVKPLLDEGINNLAIISSSQVNLTRHIVLGSSYYTRSFLFDLPSDSWTLLQDFAFSSDKIVALTHRQTSGFIGFRNTHGLSKVFLFFFELKSRKWTEHQVIETGALLDMQVITFDKQLFLFALHNSSLAVFHLDHEANLKQVLKSELPSCVGMRKLVAFGWRGALYAIITGTKTRIVQVHPRSQLACY